MFISFFVFKKEEEKTNKNISVILETEEGNIKSDTFPSNEEYEYLSTECKNTNDFININFNKETWKLNLKIEEESVDGNFYCNIYFKEKSKLASDIIIDKYSENNTDGLIKLEQPATEQTPELVEYRYSGSNNVVKNYVSFNNETWRIIGVIPTDDGIGNYENRLKIIREESIGAYSWDTSASSINEGTGINQWGESGTYNGADAMRLLNPGYENKSVNNSLYWNRESGTCYNGDKNATTSCNYSSTGLTEEAKNMVEDAKWYTASSEYEIITSEESYIQERSTISGEKDTGITLTKTTNWIGKIGLMYPSDYGYASSGCRSGEQTLYNYGNETCIGTNWLYKSISEHLLAPGNEYPNRVRYINETGYIGRTLANNPYEIRPTVYLNSKIKIASGDGTIENSYQLSL